MVALDLGSAGFAVTVLACSPSLGRRASRLKRMACPPVACAVRHRTPASATRGISLPPDDQVHPDRHVLTMVNKVIGVVNYVIAARPSLLISWSLTRRLNPKLAWRLLKSVRI